MRWLKRILILVSVLVMIASAAFADGASLRGWNKADKYQYVIFGTYPETAEGDVKPLLWRVLSVDEEAGTALLMTEYVIDMYPIVWVEKKWDRDNHNYDRITCWEEGDIYPWMNDTMSHTMFSDADYSALDLSRGPVFVLNRKEMTNANYGFARDVYGEQKSRICRCTDYALSRGVYLYHNGATYWVNDIKNVKDYRMSIVGYNGHISYAGYARQNVGLRPACTVKLASILITSGSGTLDDPYVLSAVQNMLKPM